MPSTPDAKYIVEAIDAAEEVLRIFVESLYQRGTLAWLPDRFFSCACIPDLASLVMLTQRSGPR